jgi:hypothetical protein
MRLKKSSVANKQPKTARKESAVKFYCLTDVIAVILQYTHKIGTLPVLQWIVPGISFIGSMI